MRSSSGHSDHKKYPANPSKCVIIDDDVSVRNIVGDMEKALAAGATGYFTKPIRLNELAVRLRLAMD